MVKLIKYLYVYFCAVWLDFQLPSHKDKWYDGIVCHYSCNQLRCYRNRLQKLLEYGYNLNILGYLQERLYDNVYDNFEFINQSYLMRAIMEKSMYGVSWELAKKEFNQVESSIKSIKEEIKMLRMEKDLTPPGSDQSLEIWKKISSRDNKLEKLLDRRRVLYVACGYFKRGLRE